jgi:hypothetical protein
MAEDTVELQMYMAKKIRNTKRTREREFWFVKTRGTGRSRVK